VWLDSKRITRIQFFLSLSLSLSLSRLPLAERKTRWHFRIGGRSGYRSGSKVVIVA